jgi:uncharacterized membrane protein YbaN (DUF454 family)
MFKATIYWIFLCFLEELLDATMWQTLPKGSRAWYQKIVFLIYNILDFYSFSKKILHMVLHDVIFNMTPLIRHWSLEKKFKKNCKFHSIGVFLSRPLPPKQFLHTYTCKSKNENWIMDYLLDLEEFSKMPKKWEEHLIFMIFWVLDFTVEKKNPKKNFHVWTL